MLTKIGSPFCEGETKDFHPLTLRIYDEQHHKEFVEFTAKRKRLKARLFSLLQIALTISQVYEISQAKRGEAIWHVLNHGPSFLIFMISFFKESHPMIVEILYYILGFLKTFAHIWLRNEQIKNGSYIMVNPAYMMTLGCATYLMSLSSTSYFSLSAVAVTLIFQVNFALTILFVY